MLEPWNVYGAIPEKPWFRAAIAIYLLASVKPAFGKPAVTFYAARLPCPLCEGLHFSSYNRKNLDADMIRNQGLTGSLPEEQPVSGDHGARQPSLPW